MHYPFIIVYPTRSSIIFAIMILSAIRMANLVKAINIRLMGRGSVDLYFPFLVYTSRSITVSSSYLWTGNSDRVSETKCFRA
jgi:hypothetical protein